MSQTVLDHAQNHDQQTDRFSAEAIPAEQAHAWTEQFERDGYVVVPNVISKERVKEIRALLAEKISNPENPGVHKHTSELQKKVFLPVEAKGILTDLFVNCPETLDIVCNDRLIPALKLLLGDNFVMLPDSTAHWDCYNLMHTDTTTAEQQGWMYHKEDDYRIVVVGMYLQDNHENGGGLYLVPGSHVQPDPLVKCRKELAGKLAKLQKSPWKRLLKTLSGNRLYNYDKPFLYQPGGFDVPSGAGDVIIFDMRLLHRSSYPKPGGKNPEGGKMSIFVHCSRNNSHAVCYTDYIKTKTAIYQHLHEFRDTTAQTEQSLACGFTAL